MRDGLRYGSVCSGIEAASVAWHPLGWQAAFTSEIDAFPSAVLAHRYPDVPNYGDMTRYRDWPDADLDVLIGGTPCQSFSVAGLRKGLADPRGNLALVFLGLADRYRPRWVVWENVPGVLSSNKGRDFGAFLGGLAELGYGWAYRVLDAQYVRVDGFGRAVPQRRRRVFVVGCAGDWRGAAAVLFERESLHGHTPPRREAGQVAPTVPSRRAAGGGLGTDFDCDGGLIHCADAASTLDAHYGDKMGLENQHIDHGAPLFVAHALRADGFDASEDGTGRGTPLVAVVAPNLVGNGDGHTGFRDEHGLVAVDLKQITSGANRSQPGPVSPTLHQAGTVYAIQERAVSVNPDSGPDGVGIQADHAYTLEARPHVQAVAVQCHMVHGGGVRRLTPRECERLQGFPDDYTRIPLRNKDGRQNGKWAKDGPRYKALGNSMAVNVMRWLGSRIALVEASAGARAAAPERVA